MTIRFPISPRLIDYFVPPRLARDPGLLWRARLLILTSMLGFVWGPFFAPVHYWLGESPYAAVGLVLAGLVAAIIPFCLKIVGSLHLAGNLLFAVLYGIVLVVTTARGGFPVSGLMWSISVPMLAVFLLGARSATVWLVLVAAKYLVLGGLTLSGAGIPVTMSDTAQLVIDILGLVTFLLLLVSIAWTYEHERRRALDAAEAAGRAKTDFLARMSHEIRTPMNGVLGMAGLLASTEQTALQHRYTDTIRRSGSALLRILNEILDFSKIEAGKLQLSAAPFEPRAELDDIQALFAPLAEEKGLELSVVTADTVPATLLGDAGRIRQILLNLVGNALKFTESGSIRVRTDMTPPAGIEPVASGPLYLYVTVEDTGIGIEAAALPTILDPFTQAEESASRRHEGTGLGLAISRQLSEMMGGSIHVDSVVGQGSRFVVRIGVRPCTETVQTPMSDTPPTVLGSGAELCSGHILVAEDNPINQEVTTFMLESLGYRVQLAVNGHQVLEALDRDTFDLILMDCQMPSMDGYEATRHIRARPGGRSIPILAMTANAMAEDRRRCLAIGMDGYLSKPIQPQELADAVADALRTREPVVPVT